MGNIRNFFAVFVTGCTLISGCSSGGIASTARSGTSDASASAQSASATTASTTAPARGGQASAQATPATITLAFAGDVHFEAHLRRLLTGRGEDHPALREALGAADFTLLNLETAITEGGTPIPGKAYTFRAPASALPFLQGLGVDAVSVANNHAADFGAAGLQDTLAAKASSPIPIIGVGHDATEAFTPLSIDLGGTRIAVLASSELVEQTSQLYSATDSRPGIATNHVDNERLIAAIRAAREQHDVVIVFMHWGTETHTCPDQRQVRNAKALAAAGADAIIGGHAHRVQGAGWLDNAFVGYGLGNFIWYHNRPDSAASGILTVTIDGSRVDRRANGEDPGPVITEQTWTPMLIGASGLPAVAQGDTLARLTTAKRAADTCSGLAGTPGP